MKFRLEKYFPLLTAILWGTSYVAVKNALLSFSPMAIAAGRAFFAYLALVIFYLLLGKQEYLKPKKQDLGTIALVSLAGVVLFWWLMNLGLKYTTATNSALLVASNPLFVIILSPLVIKEVVTRREWLGVVVGIIGSYLVITRGHITGLFQSQTLQGDAFSLLAGLSFAVYVLLCRMYTRKLHPGYLTVNVFGFGTLILVPLSIFSGNSPALWRGSFLALGSVVWLGLVCSAIAFLLLSTALEKTRAASASVFLFISPVIAAASAFFLLNENIGWGTVAGGLFVIAGIIISRPTKSVKPSDKQIADGTVSE